MASLKKTLPKDIQEQLARGDLPKLKALLEGCDPNARGGYGKQTVLAFDECPDEIARWMVARGADLHAADTWGYTPLHSRSRSWRGRIDVLLDLGADVNASAASIGTPLHAAADSKNSDNAAKLLSRGARADSRDALSVTPLEYALHGCSNAQIVEMVKFAKVLLGAGAERTPTMATCVQEIGKRFEFHRAGFAKDSVEATSAALDELYSIFNVVPIGRRRIHDGKAPIEVKAMRWQEQHSELWNLLVPSSGHAATIQGEVIRISGRLSREILDNGGGNWDGQYRDMAHALLAQVQTGVPLAGAELVEIRAIVQGLPRRPDSDLDRLAELAVAWVLRNLKPVAHSRPGYSL